MSENEWINHFLKCKVVVSQLEGKEKDSDVRINKIHIVDVARASDVLTLLKVAKNCHKMKINKNRYNCT